MKALIKIVVAVIALVFMIGFFQTANAAGPIHDCMNKQQWKTIGVGAAYGAGVGVLAGGLTLVALPAGAIAAPVAFVASEAVYGGLIGAGAVAASSVYQDAKGVSPWAAYCIKKVSKELVSSAQKELTESARVLSREVSNLF